MSRSKVVLMATLAVGLMALAPTGAKAKTGDIIARLGPGREPTWSPDGTMIAFVDQSAVWVMNADGSGTRTKVADKLLDRFVWTSDSRLIMASDNGRKRATDTLAFFEVAVTRNTADKGITTITSSSAQLVASAVGQRSPRRVVTGPWRLADGTVGYFDCPGSPISPGHFRPISFGSADTAQWHQMRRVVTLEEGHEFATGFGDIWLVPVDVGDGPGRRLTTGRDFQMPKTTPGGDRIAAFDTKKSSWVFMDSNGTEILPGAGVRSREEEGCLQGGAYLTWSPDAGKLAYLRSIEEDEREVGEVLSVFSLIDGSQTVLLSSEGGVTGIGTPSWSPTADRLAVSTGTSGILVLEVK